MLVLSRQLIENKYIINNYLCYLEGNHISVSHFKNNNTFLVFNEIWSAILKCNFSQPPREKQKQKFTPSPEEGLTDNQTSLMTQQTEVGGRTPTNGLLLRHIQSSLQELRPHKKGQKILQHPCSIPPPSRTQNLNSETSKKKKSHRISSLRYHSPPHSPFNLCPFSVRKNYKKQISWKFSVVRRVKDHGTTVTALSMQQPRPLLWHGFNPWPRNFHMPWWCQTEQNKTKAKESCAESRWDSSYFRKNGPPKVISLSNRRVGNISFNSILET